MLVPTPRDKLCDSRGRPYFLWDVDMTLEEFLARLAPGSHERDYWLATLLRQAKPDDALSFVTLADIRDAWPRIGTRLGKHGAFWTWRIAQRDAA
jgi:hypothetical protein